MVFTTKKIAAVYDQIAPNFSLSRGKLSPTARKLLPTLPPKAVVLDLGCGNGVLLSALPVDANYTGIDISKSLIQEAKRLHPGNQFIQADIAKNETYEKLPQFDLIVCLATLHHLPKSSDHLFVLQQIKKHLKPSGIILVSAWHLWKLKFLRYHVSFRHLAIPFHGGPKRLFYAFTKQELLNLAKKVGLTLSEIKIDGNNLFYKLSTAPRECGKRTPEVRKGV